MSAPDSELSVDQRNALQEIANIGMGRKLHELVPQARYAEAPGVGHFLPIEAPELVARKIGEFAAEVSPR